MMKRLTISWILVFAVLSGCSGTHEDDLDRWMKDRKANVKGRIAPLPELKKYVPFIYNADGSLIDPFKGRKAADGKSGGGLQPDLARPKEALESFPLESLKFVGHFQQGAKNAAMIAAPDNNTYTIHVGNYLGQNFGLVTSITRDEITVKEMIQDGTGDYTERLVTINPQE